MKSKFLLATLVATNIINCILLVILVCVGYRTAIHINLNNHDVVAKQDQVEPVEPDNITDEIEENVVEQTLISLNNTQIVETPNTASDLVVHEEIVEDIPELVDLVSDINDVTAISNATPEELNLAIKESCPWMFNYNPNMGQVYYELEQEHGINAYFALAVSFNEVGVREMSNLATKNNNTYGLMNGVKYDSIEDCTDYFFRLIKKYYVGSGLSSVEEISKKYCPGNDNASWIETVSFYMEELPNRSR